MLSGPGAREVPGMLIEILEMTTSAERHTVLAWSANPTNACIRCVPERYGPPRKGLA